MILLIYKLQNLYLKLLDKLLKLTKIGKLFDYDNLKNSIIIYYDDDFVLDNILNRESCARDSCSIFILIIMVLNYVFDDEDLE